MVSKKCEVQSGGAPPSLSRLYPMTSIPLTRCPAWSMSTCCTRKYPPSIHSKARVPRISPPLASRPRRIQVPTRTSRRLSAGFGAGCRFGPDPGSIAGSAATRLPAVPASDSRAGYAT